MKAKEFNLLYEPWILVLNKDGETEEVSLLTLMERAHEFRCLAGELPTQDVAILRLLLAALYATFTRVDVHGNRKSIATAEEALERWKSLWELKRFPIEAIKARLCYYEDNFYLFHPERPFYQVAGLHEANGKRNTIAQIVSDVPSRPERRFFSTKSGENAEYLLYSEAARWLVSMQAWDYAGKKASVVGGNNNGGGTGWLGKIGVVYPATQSLFETLLLNFVMLKTDGSLLPYGSPTWEETLIPTPKKIERRPAGYCELLTWQSRRVRLFADDETNLSLVTGVLYSYGDVFETPDMLHEQMTGWHKSTFGNTKGHFIPNRHQKERSLWRDLNSILPQASLGDTDDKLNPAVISWVKKLEAKELIHNGIIQLNATGFEYGAMDAKVESMTADILSIHSGVLSHLGEEWVPRIANIVYLTDECVKQIYHLAKNIAKATGDSGDSKREASEGSEKSAKDEAYFRLDVPFRQWLASINPGETDVDEAENMWKDTMKQTLLQLGEELAEQTGEKGMVGRWIEKDKKIYTAPGALVEFRIKIKNTIEKGG